MRFADSCHSECVDFYLPVPMGRYFADAALLISQLEPIVLILNEGQETGGSLSKGMVAGSISEFIKQLT